MARAVKKNLEKREYDELVNSISRVYFSMNKKAQAALNCLRAQGYWQIGKYIVTVEQKNNLHARYGEHLIERLSSDLSKTLGNGFSETNLKYMRQFYSAYPKSHPGDELGWSQHRALLSIKDEDKRDHYAEMATSRNWSKSELVEALKRDKVKREAINKNERKEQASHQISKQSTKLKVDRGVLYTYKLAAHASSLKDLNGKVILDCGFNLLRHIPIKGITNAKKGDIVRSIKNDGYVFKRADCDKAKIYTYIAYLERVIDGDTLLCQVDCGFKNILRMRLRLKNIDAPEISSQKGIRSKKFVEKELAACSCVVVRTHSIDIYGRYLSDIFYLPQESDASEVAEKGYLLNQVILDNAMAKRI